MKRRKNPAIDISDKMLADLVRGAQLMRPAVEVFQRAIERDAAIPRPAPRARRRRQNLAAFLPRKPLKRRS